MPSPKEQQHVGNLAPRSSCRYVRGGCRRRRSRRSRNPPAPTRRCLRCRRRVRRTLAAAYKLKQAGRSVIVLEARSRVGGRSWTVKQQRRPLHRLRRAMGRADARCVLRADQGDGLRDLPLARYRPHASARHYERRPASHRAERRVSGLGDGRGRARQRRCGGELDRRQRAVGSSGRRAARLHHLRRMAAAEPCRRTRAPLSFARGRRGAVRQRQRDFDAASRLAGQSLSRSESPVRRPGRRAAGSRHRRHPAGRAAACRQARQVDPHRPSGAPHRVDRARRGRPCRQAQRRGASRGGRDAARARRRHRIRPDPRHQPHAGDAALAGRVW